MPRVALGEYVCDHCGNASTGGYLSGGVVDGTERFFCCEQHLRDYFWEREQQQFTEELETNRQAAADSLIDGVVGAAVDAVGTVGGVIKDAFSSYKAEKAAEEAASLARIAAADAKDTAISEEIRRLSIPEDEKSLEEFIGILTTRFKSLSSSNAVNADEKKAIKDVLKKAFLNYSKVASKTDYKKLSKKWKKVQMLKNPMFAIIIWFAVMLVLLLIVNIAGI